MLTTDMYLGYNTNGLAHHRLLDAVELLAEIGYRGLGVTIDHGVLSPLEPNWQEQLRTLRSMINGYQMRSVIETGARFLLDPKRKHEPTLVSNDSAARARRVDFYRHAIRCAAELGSDCVSIWSGVYDGVIPRSEAMARLTEGLFEVLEYADEQGVAIGFEPEPGMLIDSMRAFTEMLESVDADQLGLTLDVGHLHCQGEVPIHDYVTRWSDRMVNVHLEDMRHGVHEHLMFGEGEIDFPPVLNAFHESGYEGGLYVELSRHSHEGPDAARRAFEFLRPKLLEFRL